MWLQIKYKKNNVDKRLSLVYLTLNHTKYKIKYINVKDDAINSNTRFDSCTKCS